MAKNTFLETKILPKVFVFLILILFGLGFWIVLDNFLEPDPVILDKDLKVLSQTIDPVLETNVVQEMQKRRSLSKEELASFTIYIEDQLADLNTKDLVIRTLKPSVPLDIGYYNSTVEKTAKENKESEEVNRVTSSPL